MAKKNDLHNKRIKNAGAQKKKENLMEEVAKHAADIVKNRETGEKEEIQERVEEMKENPDKQHVKMTKEEKKIAEGIKHFSLYTGQFDIYDDSILLVLKIFGNIPVVASNKEAKDEVMNAYCMFVKNADTPVQKLTNFVWLVDTINGDFYEATSWVATTNGINLSDMAKGGSGKILQV